MGQRALGAIVLEFSAFEICPQFGKRSIYGVFDVGTGELLKGCVSMKAAGEWHLPSGAQNTG